MIRVDRGFQPDPLIESNPVFRRSVSLESLCIAFICVMDLITTVIWVAEGRAREGNPLMAYFLAMGVVPFVVAKVSTFVPALVAAEWYRPYKPQFIHRLLRWAIFGYLFLYAVGVLGHQGALFEFYRSILPE